MAALAGWGNKNPRVEDWLADDDDYDFIENEALAVKEICHGRAGLIRMTLNDFGFDLARWRMFLLNEGAAASNGSENRGGWGYGHPYSASLIDHIVLSGIGQAQRPHLVALATAAWPDELMNILAWYQQEWKDPEEPLWLAAVQEWPFE